MWSAWQQNKGAYAGSLIFSTLALAVSSIFLIFASTPRSTAHDQQGIHSILTFRNSGQKSGREHPSLWQLDRNGFFSFNLQGDEDAMSPAAVEYLKVFGNFVQCFHHSLIFRLPFFGLFRWFGLRKSFLNILLPETDEFDFKALLATNMSLSGSSVNFSCVKDVSRTFEIFPFSWSALRIH